MNHFYLSAFLAFGLFCGMLLLIELGRRIGARRLAAAGEQGEAGVGLLDSAVFALLGLVIAFSFSGALSRFDTRREIITEVSNDIGTAYLRLDLLPADAQPGLRVLFRQYVEGRLSIYGKLPDVAAAKRELARVVKIQDEIWRQANVALQGTESPPATMLLLPALNAMFDILNTEALTAQIHPPVIVFIMLFGLALVASLLVGYEMARSRRHHWLHVIGFAIAIAFSVYVILDLEYPRVGLIRMDAFDQALIDQLANMK